MERLWNHLLTIRTLDYISKSYNDNKSINGSGSGTVVPVLNGTSSITCTERIIWKPETGLALELKNTYRWKYEPRKDIISLTHLRYGADNPTDLTAFVPDGAFSYRSVAPHSCCEDTYDAYIMRNKNGIFLKWRVTGPRKNAEYKYLYR